jgi:hypothetical protein
MRSWSKEIYGSPEGKTWIQKGRINSKISLFGTGSIPKKLRIGEVGDGYFLAACSALAERQDRVVSLFHPMEELNNYGFITVNIYNKGVQKTIVMDDLIMMKTYWN